MPNHSRFLMFSRNYILAALQKSFQPFSHVHYSANSRRQSLGLRAIARVLPARLAYIPSR